MVPAIPDWTVINQLVDIFHNYRGAATLIIGGTVAATSATQWWLGRRSLKSGTFRRRVLFEGVSFHESNDGSVLVEFDTHGDEYELDEVIGIPALEDLVASATRKAKDGILCLKNGISHREMMTIFERHVKGNDPIGAMDKVLDRPTNRNEVAFMPTYFREEDISMIRIYIISQKRLLGDMQDEKFVAKLRPQYEQYTESVRMIKRMAVEINAATQAHSTTARVRFTTSTTAKLPSSVAASMDRAA